MEKRRFGVWLLTGAGSFELKGEMNVRYSKGRTVLIAWILSTLFGMCLNASASSNFSAPTPLNTNATTDSGSDTHVRLETDGFGTWLAVWYSQDNLGDTIGSDWDILIARSHDKGKTWTAPTPLNLNADSDSGDDFEPIVRTDRHGNWIAVWYSNDSLGETTGSDTDILVSRSVNDGETWTDPIALNSNAMSDSGFDIEPNLATDGFGHWIVTWSTSDTFDNTIGSDQDIAVSRSTDNGVNWTDPVPLNSNAASDSGADARPIVVTDKSGIWLATWWSNDSLGGTAGSDFDILFARSTDNGQTWTPPQTLNTNAATDSGIDSAPTVATDERGNWVAAWDSGDTLGNTLGSDRDILVARSADGGQTWKAPAPLNSTANIDTGDDYVPTLVTDKQGNWVAAWYSDDTLNGTIGGDPDILIAYSIDNAKTWTAPVPLNANAFEDTGSDGGPALVTDERGNWIAAWNSDDDLGESIGTDNDILVCRRRIPTDSLVLLSPNGGERWVIGSHHIIRWLQTGKPGISVQLELLQNNNFVRVIKDATSNDGRYRWKINSNLVPGKGYKVRIVSTEDKSVGDRSDSAFRIRAEKQN